MTRTKILCVLAGLLLGLAAATQWVAYAAGYPPAFGGGFISVGGMPLYLPLHYPTWTAAYASVYPDAFRVGYLMTLGGVLLGIGGALAVRVIEARHVEWPTTYGSSRFATRADLERAGLLHHRGVIFGRFGKRYIRHNGSEHIMVFAPTRSGKGAGLVIPTLLTHTASAIIHDIKGENWQATAGWRAQFSRCVYFNPTSAHSARFNPMLEIRKGPEEVKDAQNIADILVDPEGRDDRRDHWAKTGHALLVGVILHVLYAERDKTLAGVAHFLSDPSRSFDKTLDVMMHTAHTPRQVHPVVASSARELKNKSPNELSGVLSTAMSFLGLYRDPLVARATSTSDFSIADLRHGRRPLSLYLVVPPSDLSRTKPLMRLVLNQIGRRLTETLSESPHDLLLLLDEFPSLGRLDFFESALGYLAGYGIRAFLICQSLNQLDTLYGPHNAIFDNCHARVAFAANDDRTARRISDLLGTTTELRHTRNLMGGRFSLMLDRTMVSQMETSRPLLTPGEVMQLPDTEALIFLGSFPPIRASKIRYFDDRTFRRRVLPPPPIGGPARFSPGRGRLRQEVRAAPWQAARKVS